MGLLESQAHRSMKSVVCYVPGSGGVKLCRLLAKHTTVADFVLAQHQHQARDLRKSPGEFSLNQEISRMMAARTAVPAKHGDAHESTVFLYLDQQSNLVNSLRQPIGAYLGTNGYTTTHCMVDNVAKLRYPDRFHVKILCDIRLALRRWWKVYAQDQNMHIPMVSDRFQPALARFDTHQHRLIASLVIMHLEYYQDFYDIQSDYVIDIHRGDDEFSEFMRRDLAYCQDRDFDHVWESLCQDADFYQVWRSISDKIA